MHRSRQLLIQHLYRCWWHETGNYPINRQQSDLLEGRVGLEGDGAGQGSWRLIIQAAAATLHLDIIKEEGSFALDNGLKEGTSALAGGRALW